MQCLTHVMFISLAHYYGKKPCQPYVMLLVNSQFCSCTCVDSQTNDRGLWSGNKTTCAHAYKLEYGVLHNRQELGSAVNSFTDLGRFEAMKTLSGRKALRCGKHQFHAKVMVITQASKQAKRTPGCPSKLLAYLW